MDVRKRFACKLCTKSFTRQYRVNFHIRNTHARLQVDTVCATCNRRFATTYAKNRHVNIVHRKIKIFVCDECNKTFSLRTNLQGHMRSKHDGNKLKCSTCHASFAYHFTLKEHERRCAVPTPKKFGCSECHLSYSHKRSLDAHITAKHRDKSNVCENCKHKLKDIKVILAKMYT